jgi:hypothetical protein
MKGGIHFRPRVWLLLCALTVLGGCASQASHLNSDLVAANNVCQQHLYETKIEELKCVGSNERPVVAKDFPSLLPSYDIWQSARMTAAYDLANKVTLARKDAQAVYNAAAADNARKLNIATSPVWPQSKLESDAINQELDRADATCMRDGLFISPSKVVDLRCERDARTPVVEREVPAASNAFHEYFDKMLAAAAVYDASVLPVTQNAVDDYNKAIAPALNAIRSEIQAALQADAANTARQREEATDLLAVLALGFLSGYNEGRAAEQARQPISTSCTTTGGITNCLSY